MRRYPELDALRVAACLAVVLIHTTAGWSGRVPLAMNQLARFSVPLFLLLSGFGHGGASEESWTHALRRRLGRILPPYLLWSGIYLLVDAAFVRPHAAPLRDLLFGTAYMHLYYIPVLLQFLLLSPLLRRAAVRWPRGAPLLSAVLSLAAQFLTLLHLAGKIALPFPPVLSPIPWLVFYMAGLCARRRVEHGGGLPASTAVWALSAAAILLAAGRWPFLRGETLRPGVTVYALASFTLLWRLCGRFPKLCRTLGRMSGLTFSVYLAHPLVLRLWNEWASPRGVYLPFWASWLLALAVSAPSAALLRRLPFGALLGAPILRRGLPSRPNRAPQDAESPTGTAQIDGNDSESRQTNQGGILT